MLVSDRAAWSVKYYVKDYLCDRCQVDYQELLNKYPNPSDQKKIDNYKKAYSEFIIASSKEIIINSLVKMHITEACLRNLRLVLLIEHSFYNDKEIYVNTQIKWYRHQADPEDYHYKAVWLHTNPKKPKNYICDHNLTLNQIFEKVIQTSIKFKEDPFLDLKM